MKKIFGSGLLCLVAFLGFAQTHRDVLEKELNFRNANAPHMLVLANVNGRIEVEGYDGNSVQMIVAQEYAADSEAELKRALRNVKLITEENRDTIIVRLEINCEGEKLKENNSDKIWQFYSNRNWANCPNSYHYTYDFKIRVPRNTALWMATIDKGDLKVKDVNAYINVENINGNIELENIGGQTRAHTINGNLNVRYTQNPDEHSIYYSHNGDINAYYKKGVAAKLSFKSFNGDFFTNLDEVELLPGKIQKREENAGTAYKVEELSSISIRNGKTHYEFETFNGDVYLREF